MTHNLCLPERDKLDGYLDTIESLPSPPGLMIKLIALFRQPDRDVDEIVELMRHDPSVTIALLRRCNNAFFGDKEPVTDVRESVFRLGFYEIYRIAVALCGQKTMSQAKVASQLEVEPLWRHSVFTAIAGGAMARELGESEGSAFTAGLLHDVGKIVFGTAEGPGYAGLLKQHIHCGAALNAAEGARFGFGHAEIGARLLNRWGVPEEVFVPVLCHHQVVGSGPFDRLAAIVNLANLMAHCVEKSDPDKPCELPEAVHAMELLGLKHEDLPALELLARNDIERLGAIFAASETATAV